MKNDKDLNVNINGEVEQEVETGVETEVNTVVEDGTENGVVETAEATETPIKTEAEIRAELKKQMEEEARLAKEKEEEEEKEREEERKKRNRKYRRRRNILSITFIILFMLLFLSRCTAPLPTKDHGPVSPIKESTSINSDDIVFDVPDDFDAEVNQIVCMNLTPVFYDGNSEALLYIENDKLNVYDQNIKIYMTKNGVINEDECIYESGRIKPGQTVQYDKLDKKLSKGKYSCVASFYALVRVTDEETGVEGAVVAGRTNLLVTITVQN